MGLFDGTVLEQPVLCDRCGSDVKLCSCPPEVEATEQEVAPKKQRLKVRTEKRKRGKTVTVIDGFRGSSAQRRQVLTQLKDRCGAGGTIVEDAVEIQGSHVQTVKELLASLEFRIAK